MELWDLYDEEYRLTGRTMVRGTPIPKDGMHWVVDALFLNSRGETLLQRRAKDKELLPDIWSVTGGSVLAGENGDQGCIREVTEELGFAPDMEKAKIVFHEHEFHHGWFRDVYLIRQDMPLEKMRYQEEEVQDAMWILPEQIKSDETLWQQLSRVHYWQAYYPYLCLESMRIRIPEGIYRHYKGNRYRVKGLALHSETLEPMVIYQALYGQGETWVRPASMWNETVTLDGKTVHRFEREETEDRFAEKKV